MVGLAVVPLVPFVVPLLLVLLLLLLVATTTAEGDEGAGEGGAVPMMGRCTTETTFGAGEGDFFDRFNGCWHGSREVMVAWVAGLLLPGAAALPMSTLSSRSRGEGVRGRTTPIEVEGDAGGAGEVIVEWGDWK